MPINVKGNILSGDDITSVGVLKTKVIADGLRIFLDAADVNSYSGTGTAWNDLSGNNYNFTWASTPSYTSSGLGSYFSTNNNKASGPASNAVGMVDTSGYTIQWISITDTIAANSAFKFYSTATNNRGIFAHPSWSNYTIYFDQGGCCGSDTRTSYTFAAGDFSVYRLWTLTSSVYVREIWMNDVAYATNTTAAANLALNSTAIDVGGTNESYWDARLKVFLAYNRCLDRHEISQNYQALKGRL